MKVLKRIIDHYSNKIWQKKRSQFVQKLREMNADCEAPSILSCNCTGGVMAHELGMRFMSPTVNLFMDCPDFIKLCERLEYYLSLDPVKSEHSLAWHLKDKNIDGSNTEGEYPVLLLDDLTLFMVHYHSFEEAQNKWNERKKRIDLNNIRIIATDRDGCTAELKQRFENLPYPRVMFTHTEEIYYPHCFYLRGCEAEGQTDALRKDGALTGKRLYDQFNWVEFIRNGQYSAAD